jgi:hypothetical protein
MRSAEAEPLALGRRLPPGLLAGRSGDGADGGRARFVSDHVHVPTDYGGYDVHQSITETQVVMARSLCISLCDLGLRGIRSSVSPSHDRYAKCSDEHRGGRDTEHGGCSPVARVKDPR